MRIYSKKNVYEAAIERVSRIFGEFENVVVSFSGGKDSTVVLGLAMEVARKYDRLPLPVMFVDQEAEWQTNIDYIRRIMSRDDIEAYWLQIPIRISNATSTFENWLYCWEEGKKWIRDKETNAIKENHLGTMTFGQIFPAFLEFYFGGKCCNLGGMRAEESPMRALGMTGALTYKDITYGKVHSAKREQFAFYPIYDWTYTDVWKYINDNDLDYCKIYDYMYQYGVKPRDMRVSNLHHETAIRNLFFLQEIEPDNWEAVSARLSGVSTTARHKWSGLRVDTLPEMFTGWKEYREHLWNNLIVNDIPRKSFRRHFDRMDKVYEGMHHIDDMYKIQVSALLANDYHSVKLGNWETSIMIAGWKEWTKRGVKGKSWHKNKYIHG